MKFTRMSLVAALLVGSSAFAIDGVKFSGDAKLYYDTFDTDYSSANVNGTSAGNALPDVANPVGSILDTLGTLPVGSLITSLPVLDTVTGAVLGSVPTGYIGKDSTGSTSDASHSLFEQDSARGQAAIGLGVSLNLVDGIAAGIHATALSTLGLENVLVSNTWAGNVQPTTSPASMAAINGGAFWVDNAWVATTLGKTTMKVGRMDLPSPLAFSETWNIAKNTFEAALLINQNIPGTVLIAAYVGGHNGAYNNAGFNDDSTTTHGARTTVGNAQDGANPFKGYTSYNEGAMYLGHSGLLTYSGAGLPVAVRTDAVDAVGGKGAYGFAAINNSWSPLTVQGWYYDVQRVATAYWLQADLSLSGLMAGFQYVDMTLKDKVQTVSGDTSSNTQATAAFGGDSLRPGTGVTLDDYLPAGLKKTTTAMSAMVGYAIDGVATIKGAYSVVADDGILTVQNTATGTQSKLYTEAYWNFGAVGQSGATSYMLNANATVAGMGITAQYTHVDVEHKDWGSAASMDEIALGVNTKVGPVDATVAYINTSAEGGNGYNYITNLAYANQEVSENRIQVKLAVNF